MSDLCLNFLVKNKKINEKKDKKKSYRSRVRVRGNSDSK